MKNAIKTIIINLKIYGICLAFSIYIIEMASWPHLMSLDTDIVVLIISSSLMMYYIFICYLRHMYWVEEQDADIKLKDFGDKLNRK